MAIWRDRDCAPNPVIALGGRRKIVIVVVVVVGMRTMSVCVLKAAQRTGYRTEAKAQRHNRANERRPTIAITMSPHNHQPKERLARNVPFPELACG